MDIEELKKVYAYCEKQQTNIKNKVSSTAYDTIHLQGQNKAFGLVKQKINNLLKKTKNNG